MAIDTASNTTSQQSVSQRPPVLVPTEAYLSAQYVREEKSKLWNKVWQIACREEELPKVGDYLTYEIADESMILVRSTAEKISGYYNVCKHRGRRLMEGHGQTKLLRCPFHGWTWDLQGKNVFVLDPNDWGECLTEQRLRLPEVRVDTWGGWVWINMDLASISLQEYLEPSISMLKGFEFEQMRYRWRQWLHFDCNWKVAIEAFVESYHVDVTHPQLRRYANSTWWCKAENHCSWHGVDKARQGVRGGGGTGSIRAEQGQDARTIAADFHNELANTIDATTTATLVRAANRLVDELPLGTPPEQVVAHLMDSARRDDAARGVVWPEIDIAQLMAVGSDWHIFPNCVILFGPTYALCYRARPYGDNPDACIFEVYVIERFPPGEEPATEWVYLPQPTDPSWRKILPQDFANMAQVQKGMKSASFAGAMPSPIQELSVIHFHRLLFRYMDYGSPQAAT
jgi:phenylpropionate dioxygenase-like ring-hydroxylating dioxygenase large terminal subunit